MKEYQNLSKQGKSNLHYYLITLILTVLLLSLVITSLIAYDNLQNHWQVKSKMVYLYCQKVIGKQIRKIFLKSFAKLLTSKIGNGIITIVRIKEKRNETKKNL